MNNALDAPTCAYINQIGTAVPAQEVHQLFLQFAEAMLPVNKRKLFSRMAERSGIEHRYSCVALGAGEPFSVAAGGLYQRGSFPTTERRMQVYEAAAVDLAVRAIDGLDVDLQAVTHLIVASCTGFSAPGLDQMIVDRLKLADTIERTMIGFMGCYAAVPALRAARNIVHYERDAKVLVLNLELCTLHLQEKADLDALLTFMLFGDGATACLVSSEPSGMALGRFRSQRLVNTRDLITWRIGDQGFDIRLSGQVPVSLGRALQEMAARGEGGWLGNIGGLHWAVHAGGRTMLDAVEQGLGLEADALIHSRAVLRDRGNMSSATLPHAIAGLLRSGAEGRGMALTFGPGISAEAFEFYLI